MIKKIIFFCVLTTFSIPAYANCDLASSGTCVEDSRGNAYHTERNLGGGYNTYKNGQLDSQTSSNLGGGYKTQYENGAPTRFHDTSPYQGSYQYDRNNSGHEGNFGSSFGTR